VFVDAPVVEPVDPFQGGDLDVVGGAPGPSRFDQLGLVKAVDDLGLGVSYLSPVEPIEVSIPAAEPFQ
jgi:hypothetical protein